MAETEKAPACLSISFGSSDDLICYQHTEAKDFVCLDRIRLSVDYRVKRLGDDVAKRWETIDNHRRACIEVETEDLVEESKDGATTA